MPRNLPFMSQEKDKMFHQHLNGKKEIISKIFYLKTTLIKNRLNLTASDNKCDNTIAIKTEKAYEPKTASSFVSD